jgi:drug/metabolite transporter (DMT)-like permease
MPSEQRRGLIWALGATLGVASFVVPWKVAAGLGEPITNALLLLAFAALFNSILTAYQQRRLPRFTRFDLALSMLLAAFTLLGNLASANAIQLLSPAMLTVMQRSEVIIVALLAWPFIGERIDRRFWMGATIAAVGLLILHNPLESEEVRASGMAWALTSAFWFGSMAVATRKFIHRIDPVSVNALRLWLSVVLWFAWHGAPDALYEITLPQAFYVSLAAFCGPFLGRLCMMTSARYLEARYTTLATLAAPPLTLLLGFVFLSDLPSGREIFGGVVMLMGIALPVWTWTRAGSKARRDAENTTGA